MKNQHHFLKGFTLFSAGALCGSVLLANTYSWAGERFAHQNNSPSVPAAPTHAQSLSADFINVSKSVTPAIVSIYATKMVKQTVFIPEFLRRQGFQEQEHGSQPEAMTQQNSLGSGVIVRADGIILTNNHVVAGADEVKIVLTDKRQFKAKIIGTDPKTDLAVLKAVDAKDLPVATLGNSEQMAIGEWIVAIGNPFGLSSTVTSGIISAKGRANVGVADLEDFIQTDAAINPGNSGGALVNLQGEVVGINTAIASRTGGYMGIGFAIPSNMAKKVMTDLLSKGMVTRGFLGVHIQDISGQEAQGLQAQSDNGVVVKTVEQGSPAERAGLQANDRITAVGNTEVTDSKAFRFKISESEPGSQVILTVQRGGKTLTIPVKLAELKPETKTRG